MLAARMRRVETVQAYAWADEATEATISLVAAPVSSAEALLGALGAVETAGNLSFADALDLQGTLYDDGLDDQRAVFQVGRPQGEGAWWGLVEPNGFRASDEQTLLALANRGTAVSYFWNVNAVMAVTRVLEGEVVARFDPLLDFGAIPDGGAVLPFESQPRAASLALLEMWTGVSVTESWFLATKPTFIVAAPLR
jgi:hypothetical protein